MRILYIHNDYAKPSDEETAAEAIVALLQEHGHEVEWHRRSSAEISGRICGQMKSLFAGVTNPSEAHAVKQHIANFRPDIVLVQNVYPLLSPSVFPAIKKTGIPIVMRCPNYRLFCPNGLCCDMQGHVCEECFCGRIKWPLTVVTPQQRRRRRHTLSVARQLPSCRARFSTTRTSSPHPICRAAVAELSGMVFDDEGVVVTPAITKA